MLKQPPKWNFCNQVEERLRWVKAEKNHVYSPMPERQYDLACIDSGKAAKSNTMLWHTVMDETYKTQFHGSNVVSNTLNNLVVNEIYRILIVIVTFGILLIRSCTGMSRYKIACPKELRITTTICEPCPCHAQTLASWVGNPTIDLLTPNQFIRIPSCKRRKRSCTVIYALVAFMMFSTASAEKRRSFILKNKVMAGTFPATVVDSAQASISGMIYVFGGNVNHNTNSPQKNMHMYD